MNNTRQSRISIFNFQFEKEGARRIALAEQPRPERSVLATMLHIHGSHFSMLSPSVLSMGKIVVGRKIGGESATSPPSQGLLHSLQSRPKKRAQERAIRASYGRFETPFCPADIFPREGQEAGAERGLLVLVEQKQRDCNKCF